MTCRVYLDAELVWRFRVQSFAQLGTRKGSRAQELRCARARACGCLAACSSRPMLSYLSLAATTCSGRAYAAPDETRRDETRRQWVFKSASLAQLGKRKGSRAQEPPPPRVCAEGGARTLFVSLLEHTLVDRL